jgi:hypothetical protein
MGRVLLVLATISVLQEPGLPAQRPRSAAAEKASQNAEDKRVDKELSVIAVREYALRMNLAVARNWLESHPAGCSCSKCDCSKGCKDCGPEAGTRRDYKSLAAYIPRELQTIASRKVELLESRLRRVEQWLLDHPPDPGPCPICAGDGCSTCGTIRKRYREAELRRDSIKAEINRTRAQVE